MGEDAMIQEPKHAPNVDAFANANVESADASVEAGDMEDALRKYRYAAKGLSRLDGLEVDDLALLKRAHRGIVLTYSARLNVGKSEALTPRPDPP